MNFDLIFVIFVVAIVRDTTLGSESAVPVASTTSKTEGHVYHGLIREDAESDTTVDLDTPLVIGENKGTVCGFTVFKSGASPVPFQVILSDPKTGRAQIVLARGQRLNYEQTAQYEFEIAADDCVTGEHSNVRSRVRIQVEDVNDFAPVWREQTYLVEAVEGILYKRLLKLEAVDRDGTEAFSKICSYILLTEDVPFKIDQQGYLQNTEPLDYSVKHNFILEVVAEDCGHKRSDRLLVNIIVKPECKVGWKGIRNNVDYSTPSRREDLTNNSILDLCGATCRVKQATVAIKLIPEHKEPIECPIDSAAITARNTFCGVSKDSVALLPEGDSKSSDKKNIFTFDGKKMVYDVPVEKFSGHLEKRFSISTWLRHEELEADAEAKKQHIICSADEEGMNRHHYSLFLHNCRLILLLRQEPGQGVDMNVFNPAEWRWRLDEVCDGKWHHYTVSVDYPKVRLYVDGKMVVTSKHQPDIIDDWPLHVSKKVRGTKLSVGACWEGTEHHHAQHLTGELTGLTILNNSTESDQSIQCINNCQEKLDFHAVAEMEAGMSISMNSEMSQLSITGHTMESVEKLLNRVGYINSHDPSRGISSNTLITYETTVTCDDGSNLSIGTASTVITLLSDSNPPLTPSPTLTVSASTHLTRSEPEVEAGVQILADLVIYFSQPLATSKADIEKLNEKHKLSSCIVHMEPKMDAVVESLLFDEDLARNLQLKATLDPYGMTIIGLSKIADFLDVLRGVTYKNKNSEELRARTFSLMCSSEPDTKATSNQLIVELSTIHNSYKEKPAAAPGAGSAAGANIDISRHEANQAVLGVGLKSDEKLVEDMDRHSSGAGMAVIAVVCVGFLLFLIGFGVMRIRSTQSRSLEVNMEDKQEMEWDNSAITITVNPMERDQTIYDETELSGLQGGHDSDSDDDIGSFHDDEPDSSDGENDDGERSDRALKDEEKGLEWDSSTHAY